MPDIRTIHLKILQGQLREIAGELMQVQFRGAGVPSPWRPHINLYRCTDRFVVCVDLAGIDRNDIQLRAEPLRLSLRGRRPPPVPEPACGDLLQILALEIDDGTCAREILLPEEIIPEKVRAEQRNGLLWIDLPLLSAG
jgi:HSP20 family molecular chaperone IbpA